MSRYEKMAKNLVRKGLENISEREQEVLDHLLDGCSNKEIARRMHISYRTVETHLQTIRGKSGIQSRWDLAKEYHAFKYKIEAFRIVKQQAQTRAEFEGVQKELEHFKSQIQHLKTQIDQFKWQFESLIERVSVLGPQ